MSEQRNWYDQDNNQDADNNPYDNNSYGNNQYNNNSYNNPYNNPYAREDNPYGTPSDPAGTNPRFAKASMVCGFIALGLTITGVLAIPVGAIGLLFACLSARRGKNIPKKAKSGIITGALAIIIGIMVTVTSLISIMPSIRDGSFIREYEQMYKSIYGEDLNLGNYGLDVDGYNSFQDYLDNSNTFTR